MINEERIRRDFPSLGGKVYLNTAAEGIPPNAVGGAIMDYWRDKQLGMEGRDNHFKTETACREVTARMLSLSADEVSFCSCSAEAYNLLASTFDFAAGDEVVVSDLDFPSGTTPWLLGPNPPHVRLWRAVEGKLNLDDLSPLLNERTRLVQVSLVSFYNGHRIPWVPFADHVRSAAAGAVVAVDVTQALGRCVLDCASADIVISSTHKWSLGIHGGCVVGVRSSSAGKLTARAGGWYNRTDPFGTRRFERADTRPGAASFATGMPNFAAIYALNSGLRYLETIGVDRVAAHADPLVAEVRQGLRELGLQAMSPPQPGCSSGIVSFRHGRAAAIGRALRSDDIHVMSPDDRIRISVHGYNTREDVERLLKSLRAALRSSAVR